MKLPPQIKWEKPTSMSTIDTRMLRATRGIWKGHQGFGFGIDPGVNFGVVHIIDEQVLVLHGALTKEEKPGQYAIHADNFMMNMARTFSPTIEWICIIEGAAYNKTFGQVGLEEVRIGFFLGARRSKLFNDVRIVPPATIRKRVFADHLKQAGDVWPKLNHNGADALSMALYSLEET